MISELGGDSRHGRRGDRSKHWPEMSGLQKKVVDSLVYRYLLEKGCDYTVSVFLPEVNLTKSEVSGSISLLLKLSVIAGIRLVL